MKGTQHALLVAVSRPRRHRAPTPSPATSRRRCSRASAPSCARSRILLDPVPILQPFHCSPTATATRCCSCEWAGTFPPGIY